MALALLLLIQDVAWEEYYPLKVGAEWIYMTDKQAAISKVIGKTRVGEIDTYIVEEWRGDKKVKAYLSVTGTAVMMHKYQDQDLKQPVVLLRFPLKKGQKWEVGGGKVKCEVQDEEEIEVDAGKFKCVRVRMAGENSTTEQWIAKGVGVVKFRTVTKDGERVTSLKKFIPGKD